MAAVDGLPPGTKFDPADDDLIARFLLPRMQGKDLPFVDAILEADPLSAPPWELLRYHGGRKGDAAFFFAAAQAKNGKGSRKKRTVVGGGCWQGQRVCVDGERLRVPGVGEIAWRKYMLNFHADGERGSSGWVMHEYSVTAPTDLASSPIRLYRIRFSGYGKKRMREPQGPGGHDDDDDGSRARAAPRRAVVEPTLFDEHAPPLHPVPHPAAVADYALIADQGSSGLTDHDLFVPNLELLDTDDMLHSFPDFAVPDPFFLPAEECSDLNQSIFGDSDLTQSIFEDLQLVGSRPIWPLPEPES